MSTYRCDNMRPIHTGDEFGESRIVENVKDAAFEFANRIARRTFGKRGYCHLVQLDCYAADGRYSNYEAFIGVPAEGGGTNGKNVFLTIYIKDTAP